MADKVVVMEEEVTEEEEAMEEEVTEEEEAMRVNIIVKCCAT